VADSSPRTGARCSRRRGRRGATSFEALSRLCQTYWYPLYSYVRRRGYDADTAADLTQSFFAELLSKNYVGQADPARDGSVPFCSRPRAFSRQEWQKSHRLKRGGGVPLVSFDAAEANDRWQSEDTDRLAATPCLTVAGR